LAIELLNISNETNIFVQICLFSNCINTANFGCSQDCTFASDSLPSLFVRPETHQRQENRLPMNETDAVSVRDRFNHLSKVREDINIMRDYVKEDLFYRMIFVFKDEDLEEGNRLYRDYMTNCKGILAGKTLNDAPEEEAQAYMKYLWTLMLKEKSYKEWLSVKRSNAYQAVQDKFGSK